MAPRTTATPSRKDWLFTAARRVLLAALGLLAVVAIALWAYSYFHYVTFDPVMLQHRDAAWSTTKEATLFTYRGGAGLLLRRRFIPVDFEVDPTSFGWTASGPSLHIGPSISRDEFAVGKPVVDVAGVFVGRDRGPHPGFGPTSLVVDHVIALPLWLVALLTGLWPARVLVRWRRERRTRSTAGFQVIPPREAAALAPAATRP